MIKPLISISYQRAIYFAAFLVLYEFLTYIANDMIMPGMLSVVAQFHGKESDIASSLTAYILGGASLQVVLGPLSDAYGRRPVMLFGAVFFLLCTIGIACSQNMSQFLMARYFQGMGLCFIGAVGYALLQEIFNESDAVRFTALMASVTITAPLIGPLIGAFMVHHWSWRYVFYSIAVLSVVSVIGLWRFMPESVGQQKRDGEWFQPVPFRLDAILKNYKTLLFSKKYLLSITAGGLAGLPCIIWIALAPVIIVKTGHQSLVVYGYWQIPVFAAAILGNLCLQYLTRRFEIKHLILFGSVMMLISLIVSILPYYYIVTNRFEIMMPGLIGYFFGLSILASPLYRYSLFITNVAKGTVSAMMSIVWMLIQAIGVEIGNIVYHTHNNIYLSAYFLSIAIVYIFIISWLFITHTRETII